VVLALDASADPPVLWYSEARASYRQFKLLRIEDRGDSFGEQVDISRLAGNGKRRGAPARS